MNCIEYGKGNETTVALLHGGGLSWWNYRQEAELLADRYHVILPVIDGHAGSDRPFTSIKDSAARIIAYIDTHFDGTVALIGGLSLGAQIVIEVLSQRADAARFALIESAAVIPSPLTGALIAPAFFSSYGLIKKRSFAKLQFASLRMKPELFEDYYRDTCAITKEDMIAFMKASTAYSLPESFSKCRAKVNVIYGEKETSVIRRSAEKIRTSVEGSACMRMEGLYHGEFSLNYPERYAEMVRMILDAE